MSGWIIFALGFCLGAFCSVWVIRVLTDDDKSKKEISRLKKLVEEKSGEALEAISLYNEVRQKVEEVENEKINFNVDDFYNSIKQRL